MKTTQQEQLQELADQIFLAIKKCSDYATYETPNADVGMMLMVIHQQLTEVLEQE